MRDDQRPQSPWARGARAAERHPARPVYPPVVPVQPVQPEMPWPEYPPGDQPEYGAAAYQPGLPPPELSWEPEGEAPPGRDRRRMLVVVAAVAAVVGGGALVAVVLGGSHPQKTRQVADTHTAGPAVIETGPDTPSASPSTASPSASPSATPSKVKAAAPRVKSTSPAPLKYAAVTGPGCETTGAATYNIYGKGWGVTGGNANGGGCGVPALYTATGDSSGADRVGWWWNPAFNRPATCTFSVYVPNTDKATATRATYEVFHGSQPLGTFRINQAASRGSWVTSPAYQTPDKIWVQLADRGATGYSLAVGAVRASCTG